MYLLLHKCSCLANLFFAFFVVVVVTFLLFHFGYLQKLFADIYLSFSKNISVNITPKLNLKDIHKMYRTLNALCTFHCVKIVRIRSYFGPHFPAFGLNKERYSVSLRIPSECGIMRARITPNRDTFYAVFNLGFTFSFW